MKNPMFNNRFGKESTAGDVLKDVNLNNRLVVLTGATAGIGIATAQALVTAGADLIVGARNSEKLNNLLDDLRTLNGAGTITGFTLNLMSIDSVDRFADAVLKLNRPVDILINNAGIIGPLQRNNAGIESQLMTNFIGHALLTSRLSKALQQSHSARVVSLASFGHHYADIDFNDLNFERRPYTAWESYGQSKTACVLLAVQIAEKLGKKGIEAFAVHPGAIITSLGEELEPEDIGLAKEKGSIPAPGDWKTPEQGAATTVWAATAPELTGRSPLYLEDCGIADVLETPTYNSGVMRYALLPENAAKLWAATEKLIARKLPL